MSDNPADLSDQDVSDRQFLRWLHRRLLHVYGEPEGTDFVMRLAKIAESLPS